MNHFINDKSNIQLEELSRKNIIKICRGTICHVNNSVKILKTIEKELDIKAGETFQDKNFVVEIVACLNICSLSPVICVNDDYYGGITIEEIPKILSTYKNNNIVKKKLVDKVSVY